MVVATTRFARLWNWYCKFAKRSKPTGLKVQLVVGFYKSEDERVCICLRDAKCFVVIFIFKEDAQEFVERRINVDVAFCSLWWWVASRGYERLGWPEYFVKFFDFFNGKCEKRVKLTLNVNVVKGAVWLALRMHQLEPRLQYAIFKYSISRYKCSAPNGTNFMDFVKYCGF